YLLQQHHLQKRPNAIGAKNARFASAPFSNLANLAASLYGQQLLQQNSNNAPMDDNMFMRPQSQAQSKLRANMLSPTKMLHQIGATNVTPAYMDRYFAAGRDSFILNNFLIQNDSRSSTETNQFQQPSQQQMHLAAIT